MGKPDFSRLHQAPVGGQGAALVDDRERLFRRLRAAGCSDAELEQAQATGKLPTLAVEQALGGVGTHTLTGAAGAARLDTRFFRELMQAMGRPSPARGERVLTDDDVEIARLARRFLDAGLAREDLIEVGRVLSMGTSHTAEAVRRVVGNAFLRPGDSEATVGLRYTEAVDQLAPLVPPLLSADFRAHLRNGIRSQLVTEAEREAGELNGTREVTVGFADLVDYTRLGERLAPEDVGRIAGRLVEISSRAAVRPVTMVKTIGDAAMFVSPEPAPLIETMVELVRNVGQDADLPSVHAGAAHGPAITRGGDWFGATVNLASRVTDAAKAGTILVTEDVQTRVPARDWKRKRRLRSLRGISDRVRLFSLSVPTES